MKKKFIIAGGGTGGHIYPGIAIAKAIEGLSSGSNLEIEVEFVGSRLGLESKIVPREGYKLHLLAAGKLNYQGAIFGKLWGLLKVLVGFFQSFVLLAKLRPAGVLGVGGYASGPFLLAARICGLPTAVWEPNAHPGLTNRWLAKVVDQTFVVFEEARVLLNTTKIEVVGLPVRAELENLRPGFDAGLFRVLSFGGSQGARALNTALKESVIREMPWLYKAELVHQTGVSDYQSVQEVYQASVFEVKAFEYLFEMDKHYEWAHLVICRSGASTIAELSAVGMPSILVPLPTAADDHQKKNAQVLVDKGAAIMIEQKDLTPELLNKIILELKSQPEQLKAMSLKAKALYKPKAAETIARRLLVQISNQKSSSGRK